MLSVRMLGVFTIKLDSCRLADELGPAGRLFAGYLFEFLGRVHRRERLADQFWGHLNPDRARAALNTALWRLRKLLARDHHSKGGQNLRTYGSEIVLEPVSWLDIDTHQFDAAIREMLDPPQAEDAAGRLGTLETAIQSYAGPFLEGEDADWILEERERLHSLYVRAASELVRSYGCAERYEDAIAAVRRIVAADPFRESVFRSFALLLVLNGQRADALRQYERWSTLFRRELGINPMPQTLHLAEEIRSGQIFEHLEAVKAQFFPQSGDKVRGPGFDIQCQNGRSMPAAPAAPDRGAARRTPPFQTARISDETPT